jgi:hypothetical protein
VYYRICGVGRILRFDPDVSSHSNIDATGRENGACKRRLVLDGGLGHDIQPTTLDLCRTPLPIRSHRSDIVHPLLPTRKFRWQSSAGTMLNCGSHMACTYTSIQSAKHDCAQLPVRPCHKVNSLQVIHKTEPQCIWYSEGNKQMSLPILTYSTEYLPITVLVTSALYPGRNLACSIN